MTPLHAARQMAKATPWFFDRQGSERCFFCDAEMSHDHLPSEHVPSCYWFSMPRIVAVLEAAARLVKDEGEPVEDDALYGEVFAFCDRPWEDLEHADDCRWQALITALRGEEPG